jgi:glycosyltransferase involved in cell wall biosynthesis
MKVLFIHPNQPSQFKLPALEFAKDPANEVVFLSQKNLEVVLPGVKVIGFKGAVPAGERPHKFARRFNEGCHRAMDVASACLRLKQQGFVPDVIVAHSGWGEGMYLRAVLPDTPQLNYMEFYFQPQGADLGFIPGTKPGPDVLAARSTDNAIHAMNFFNADWCITPTYWQKSVYPLDMHHKMSVLHEGVDTQLCAPQEWEQYRLPNGQMLNPQTDEIITHVERHFDRYRGIHTFIESIDIIQKRRPNAHVVIVGKEGQGYSPNAPFGEMIRQAPFDRSRTHFLGHLNYFDYLKLLQVSSAHIYLTYPFVLSWSLLEAMSIGCPIACSDTPPVKEVAESGKDCLMFDFFDATALADRVDALLDDRDLGRRLGAAARQKIVEQYNVRDLLPMAMQLIHDVAAGEKPVPAAQTIQKWNQKWGREDEHWQASVPLFQSTI